MCSTTRGALVTRLKTRLAVDKSGRWRRAPAQWPSQRQALPRPGRTREAALGSFLARPQIGDDPSRHVIVSFVPIGEGNNGALASFFRRPLLFSRRRRRRRRRGPRRRLLLVRVPLRPLPALSGALHGTATIPVELFYLGSHRQHTTDRSVTITWLLSAQL